MAKNLRDLQRTADRLATDVRHLAEDIADAIAAADRNPKRKDDDDDDDE